MSFTNLIFPGLVARNAGSPGNGESGESTAKGGDINILVLCANISTMDTARYKEFIPRLDVDTVSVDYVGMDLDTPQSNIYKTRDITTLEFVKEVAEKVEINGPYQYVIEDAQKCPKMGLSAVTPGALKNICEAAGNEATPATLILTPSSERTSFNKDDFWHAGFKVVDHRASKTPGHDYIVHLRLTYWTSNKVDDLASMYNSSKHAKLSHHKLKSNEIKLISTYLTGGPHTPAGRRDVAGFVKRAVDTGLLRGFWVDKHRFDGERAYLNYPESATKLFDLMYQRLRAKEGGGAAVETSAPPSKWQSELEVLARMRFTDEAILVPLLEKHAGSINFVANELLDMYQRLRAKGGGAAVETSAPPSKWQSELKFLAEMGYADKAILVPLLEKHAGSIKFVVNELLG